MACPIYSLPNIPDHLPEVVATGPSSSRDLTWLLASSSSRAWQKTLLSFLVSAFPSWDQKKSRYTFCPTIGFQLSLLTHQKLIGEQNLSIEPPPSSSDCHSGYYFFFQDSELKQPDRRLLCIRLCFTSSQNTLKKSQISLTPFRVNHVGCCGTADLRKTSSPVPKDGVCVVFQEQR